MESRDKKYAERTHDLCSQLKASLPSTASLRPLLSTVREAFAADSVMFYEPRLTDARWDVAHEMSLGSTGEDVMAQRFRALVRCVPVSSPWCGAYEPFNAEPTQRNRALTLRRLTGQKQYVDAHRTAVFNQLQIEGQDQLRMILCNGPRVIGHVGMVRAEAFGAEEVAMMQALAERSDVGRTCCDTRTTRACSSPSWTRSRARRSSSGVTVQSITRTYAAACC